MHAAGLAKWRREHNVPEIARREIASSVSTRAKDASVECLRILKVPC